MFLWCVTVSGPLYMGFKIFLRVGGIPPVQGFPYWGMEESPAHYLRIWSSPNQEKSIYLVELPLPKVLPPSPTPLNNDFYVITQ